MLDQATLHRRASRVLPASLRTRGLLTEAQSTADLAELLLPLWHRPRGSLWFRLDEVIAQRLRDDPLACLREAPVARAGLARHAPPRTYEAWQPVASTPQAIYAARSQDQHACLWLLPAAALLIYAWDDAPCATVHACSTRTPSRRFEVLPSSPGWTM
ncbi:hypothetical protein [Pseudoxanthomonas indica]|uniref:Uncharacterized protein n=1 Tax=Pseudoxanthomonas indica TaxID=428993 RepID=A0A1T5LSL8_9GAMM|nr:hypothetical protein [Pseudoxanthomonas indica]GGD38942.1 hypothetical protein GCM10007235_08850 [Pseudoxanthomonas indica]SKC78884.1 hypothetical protein SAMN06296058_3005 [Pseudoxanthomonas indica]